MKKETKDHAQVVIREHKQMITDFTLKSDKIISRMQQDLIVHDNDYEIKVKRLESLVDSVVMEQG